MGKYKRKNLQLMLINFSIEDFTNYVNKMEEFLETEVNNFNNTFDERTVGWSEEDKNEYGEFLSDEYFVLAETYPNFLRTSMFISIYSFFESKLKELCKYYHITPKNNSTISKKNKSISKILKFLNYMEQHFDIKFSEIIDEWVKIDEKYRVVRNILAHDSGEIKIDEIDYYVSKFKGLPVEIKSSLGDLIPQKELCFDFLKDINSFFDNLFRLISEKESD